MRLFDGSVLYWNNQQDAYSKAECYREGRLVKKSIPRALKLYQEAAKAGDAQAMFRLGEHYQQSNQKLRAFSAFYEAGIRDNASAITLLQTLANGDAEAAFLLGKMYEQKKNYTQAIAFYKKAHELKHADGMYHVAKLFTYINYSEKQGKEVSDYYRDAVKAGSKHALVELIELSKTSGKAAFYVAQLYERDLKQMNHALSYYEKASQLHFGEATYTLGNIYAQGKMSVAVDIARASRYYITASQQGHYSSISSLQSLAQQGYAEAQYVLGYEYYRNRNELSSAIAWCVKAEVQNHARAANYLRGSFSKEMTWKISKHYAAFVQNKEHNQPKAVEYAVKASDLGVGDASEYLANSYYQGREGVPVDRIKSYCYFIIAIKQGKNALLKILDGYAEANDKDAQYALYDYYRDTKKEELSLRWLVRAGLSRHADAQQKLKEDFSAEQHWRITDFYLENGVTVDDQRWMFHCQKAADKGHAQAAFYLAQQSEGINANRHRASLVTRYSTASNSYNVEAQAATQRFSEELIYTRQNSRTLFIQSNNSGSVARQLSSVQQKMKRK